MTVGFTACIVLLAARLETALIAALIRFLIPFLAKKKPARLTSIMQFIKLPPPPNIISPFYTKWEKMLQLPKTHQLMPESELMKLKRELCGMDFPISTFRVHLSLTLTTKDSYHTGE